MPRIWPNSDREAVDWMYSERYSYETDCSCPLCREARVRVSLRGRRLLDSDEIVPTFTNVSVEERPVRIPDTALTSVSELILTNVFPNTLTQEPRVYEGSYYERLKAAFDSANVEYQLDAPMFWPFPEDDTEGTFLNLEDEGLYNHPYVMVCASDWVDDADYEDGDENLSTLWVNRNDLERFLTTLPQPEIIGSLSRNNYVLRATRREGFFFPAFYNSIKLGQIGELDFFWEIDANFPFERSETSLLINSSIFNTYRPSIIRIEKCCVSGVRNFYWGMIKVIKAPDESGNSQRDTWVTNGARERFWMRNVERERLLRSSSSYPNFLDRLELTTTPGTLYFGLSSNIKTIGFTIDDLKERRVVLTFKVDINRFNRRIEESRPGNFDLLSFIGAAIRGTQEFASLSFHSDTGLYFKGPANLSLFETGRASIEMISVSNIQQRTPPSMRENGPRDHIIWNYSRDVVEHMGLSGPEDFYRTENEKKVPLPRKTPFFGVELEVQPHKMTTEEALEKVYNELGDHNIICKDDASIGDGGFEIVTVPATFEYHREMWPKFFKTSRKYLRSWNTSSCGLHVHISKSAFTDAQQDMFVHFFDKPENLPFIQNIAGRSIQSYAKVYHDKPIKDKIFEKYRACNILKDKTLEVRIFRGTVHPNGFFKALEFVASLHEFILSLKANASDKQRVEDLLFAEYLTWLRRKYKKYPVLHKWLSFRGYYTKSKGLVSKTKVKKEMAPVLKRIEKRASPPKKNGPTTEDKIIQTALERRCSSSRTSRQIVLALIEFNNLRSNVSNEVLSPYIKGNVTQFLLDKRDKDNLWTSWGQRDLNYWQSIWNYRTKKAFLYVGYQMGELEEEARSLKREYNVERKSRKVLNLYDLIDEDIQKDFDEDHPVTNS